VDLTEPFVKVAKLLTERAGLTEKVEFLHGNALDLPVADVAFDMAWMQHVAMNIADRPRLYLLANLAQHLRDGRLRTVQGVYQAGA
jgi:ubiquinone/menaquinone biosynthesis C-methylase UbiE